MFHSDLIGCQVRLAPNSQVLVEGELFASVKFSDALWTLGSLSSLSCAFEYFFFLFLSPSKYACNSALTADDRGGKDRVTTAQGKEARGK